ncbi:conserved phage C-terminal domain-containing protein [uncultured Clostridium sp.]|uniref:conserved phage C-terminal domain-containing protein n=1 Tax=uncultured Clostridium sp. TaxID=59620 RepID=UPI0025908306|nr:conserved phage C-terminal domain-containing protein [uncultured Clostridium sp.]
MKFTFMGFSQSKALEMNLDDKDLSILRYFIDFKDSGSMSIKIIDDKPYYWVKYEALLNELPILGIKSKDVLRRRLKALVDAEVLSFILVKKGGCFSFYGIGPKYKDLISSDEEKQPTEKSDHPTQKSEPSYPKVGTLPTQKSEQIINLLKDPSTKDINNISEKVIEFLNLKANTKYKANTKSTQRLIRARISDGFTLEDFKKVICNKTKEWQGTEFEKFLRPSTLFRESKFEEYLNQKENQENNLKDKSMNLYNDFEFDD